MNKNGHNSTCDQYLSLNLAPLNVLSIDRAIYPCQNLNVHENLRKLRSLFSEQVTIMIKFCC